jgi:hypothetical protein
LFRRINLIRRVADGSFRSDGTLQHAIPSEQKESIVRRIMVRHLYLTIEGLGLLRPRLLSSRLNCTGPEELIKAKQVEYGIPPIPCQPAVAAHRSATLALLARLAHRLVRHSSLTTLQTPSLDDW